LSGNIVNPTDQALLQIGLTRRIAFTVNQFSSAVPMIIGSDLIAILPTDLVHSYLTTDKLTIVTTPLDIPHSSISMLWHKRQSMDAGLVWLRKEIKGILLNRRGQQIKEVQQAIKK